MNKVDINIKKQLSSDFMAAVTIHSDSGAQKEESVTISTFSPSICLCSNGARRHDLNFFKYLVISWLLLTICSANLPLKWANF